MKNKLQLPPCCYRVSVKAIIFDETRTKILLFKEDDDTRSLPWWGLEFGYNPHEELARELKEEAGLEVMQIDKRPLSITTRKKRIKDLRLTNIMYETKVKDLNFTPSKECKELWFFTKKEAQKLTRHLQNTIDPIDF